MKRGRGNGGFFQRIGLLLAAVVILALTFTLGVLVGRQWGGRPAEIPTAPGSAALTRRALNEVEADRRADGRSSFCQTLTAPLAWAVSRAAEERGVARRPPPPALTAPPSVSPQWRRPLQLHVMWTVQVGAFRSRSE
jgi:hypothetical protein